MNNTALIESHFALVDKIFEHFCLVMQMNVTFLALQYQNQIECSIYSRYHAEACDECRVPSPRFSAWTTQV